MPITYTQHPAYVRWQTGQYGDNGSLNESWRAVFEADPGLQGVAFCVELVFGLDYIVRISNKHCASTSSMTGAVHQWLGALGDSPEITWEYTPGDPNSMAKSLSLRLPNELVDCAALIRQARILGGVAEVSLQIIDGDYDERLVLLRGDLTDVEYGARTQLVTCSITDPKDSSDLQLPPYALDSERFPALIDASVGQVLAVVAPEFGPLPAHFVTASTTAPKVVACHGHLDVDTVYVDGVSYAPASVVYPWGAVQDMDALGEPYTGVQFTGAGSGTFDGEGGEKVYIEVSGGQPSSGHPVDLVQWAVEGHTTMGRFGGAKNLFSRARARAGFLKGRLAANAGGSGNVKTISFIEGTFLESFPMISMVWAEGGYGPVVTDRRDILVRHHLVADQWPILDRATLFRETPKGETFNTFSISYNYDPLADEYQGYAKRSPANSDLCRLSEKVVGPRQAATIESLYITEDATAESLMDWMVAHLTLPAHDVEYDVSPVLILQTVIGDNVALTDSEFGYSSATATVKKLVFRPARGTLGLRVWNDAMGLGGGAASTGGTTSGAGGQ